MSEKEIEQEIQDKGLTAPRLTPDLIDSVIIGEKYFTALQAVDPGVNKIGFRRTEEGYVPVITDPVYAALSTLTFCVLVLKNGFTVTGESACASPENFNKELGQKIARENARNKIWALEGYLLKQKLYEDQQ